MKCFYVGLNMGKCEGRVTKGCCVKHRNQEGIRAAVKTRQREWLDPR